MADLGPLSIAGLEIPLEDVSGPTMDGGLDTAEQNVLDAIGSATAITSPPPSLDLSVVFDGPRASMRAAELAELANAPASAPVAVSGLPANGLDGYYLAPSVRRDARLAQTQDHGQTGDDHDHERVELTLTRVGTHGSHWRAIRSAPIQVDNEFGTDLAAPIGVPASATKVRWVDPDTGTSEVASPIDTRIAEGGELNVYDATAPTIDDPTLIYSLPYVADGRLGLHLTIWDSHDRPQYDETGGATVGEAIVGEATVGPGRRLTQWQHVFEPSHGPTGDPIVDNGLFKCRFDVDEADGDGVLWASEWTPQDGWTQLSLEYAGWRLYDVDLVSISTAAIDAQVTFRNLDTGQLFVLDMSLQRGFERPLWIVPPNETGPIPTGLATTLEPIASAIAMDPQPAVGLTSRAEIRQ